MHSTAFQILADPMRLSIVEALRDGEQSVNDIVEKVNIHQSGVSRHLRLLKEAGFVQVRADGTKRHYSLCGEPFRELEAWVDGYRQIWETRLDRFEEALYRKHDKPAPKSENPNE
jgi:DNA-binding transcriptional ArsR family regulator